MALEPARPGSRGDRRGRRGPGEACPGYAYTGETAATVTAVIASHLAPALIGRDPLAIEAIARRWEETGVGNEAARGALEMALWDVKGKVLGRPLYELLGGLSRRAVHEAYPLDREEAGGGSGLESRRASPRRGRGLQALPLPGDERELRDDRLELVAVLARRRRSPAPRSASMPIRDGEPSHRAVAGIKRTRALMGSRSLRNRCRAGDLEGCRREYGHGSTSLCASTRACAVHVRRSPQFVTKPAT